MALCLDWRQTNGPLCKRCTLQSADDLQTLVSARSSTSYNLVCQARKDHVMVTRMELDRILLVN